MTRNSPSKFLFVANHYGCSRKTRFNMQQTRSLGRNEVLWFAPVHRPLGEVAGEAALQRRKNDAALAREGGYAGDPVVGLSKMRPGKPSLTRDALRQIEPRRRAIVCEMPNAGC